MNINSKEERKAYIQQIFDEFMKAHSESGVSFKGINKKERSQYIKSILNNSETFWDNKKTFDENFMKNLYNVIYVELMRRK